MRDDRSVPSMWMLVLYSALFSGVVYLGLKLWQNEAKETPQEAATRAGNDFQKTIDNLASGNRTMGESADPSIPWPAEHAVAVALIMFVVLCIVCRLYIFMRRLEERNRYPT